MTRSRAHMLSVAAARLEAEHANPKLIADLREAAKAAARVRAEGRLDNMSDADERRIERQRTLFAMLPDNMAVDRLRSAMLQRAYDLMWDGDCSGCDALAEFLPSAEADRMFDAWERDQAPGDQPRSEFYGGTQ